MMNTIRVMIVDDSETWLAAVGGLLSQFPGVRIAGLTSNGEEALGLAKHVDADVVIMDLCMPGIGGYQAIRLLKSRRRPPGVVALTLLDSDADREAAFAAGADQFLSKYEVAADNASLLNAIRLTRPEFMASV
jgi:DNA-binding NarL/FixJ family response regulator